MKEFSKVKYDGKKGLPVLDKSYQRATGTWRVFRPVLDRKKCTKCHLCILHCPEAAIKAGQNDYPETDYSICKGCLICLRVCPVGAIEDVREKK